MGLDGFIVLALALGTLILLLTGKATLDAVGIGLIVLLTAFGILDFGQAVSGFSNSAVLTIAGLYVIAEALTDTGAVGFLADFAERISGGRQSRTLLLTGLTVAFGSAFLNDTAIVLVFIPVVIQMARKADVPNSRLMMPMAFAAILGGMCTLVGTSTNLLVSGIAVTSGLAPLGMFELTPVGVSMTLAGVVFMAAVGARVLPDRPSLSGQLFESEHREYITELQIGRRSPLIGRPFKTAFEGTNLRVLFFVREEQIHWPSFAGEQIRAGDVVMVEGELQRLVGLQGRLDLAFFGDVRIDPRRMRLYEVSVSPRSGLGGVRVEDLHLQRDYGAVVLAVLRAGQHIHESIGRFPVRAGDLLLVAGTEISLERLAGNPDFFVVESRPGRAVRRSCAPRALAVALGVVALFILDSAVGVSPIPIPAASLLGAATMVAVGCISARRVYRAIDWRILIFIAGSIALGEAMKETGAARFLALGLVGGLSQWGPAVVAGGLIFLCLLFNTLAPPSAIAAVFTPIAIAAASTLAAGEGLLPDDPRAVALSRGFVLAVAYGGSICFHSPLGHQVNLMVFGPGGYRYTDFIRLGLPVSLIAWMVASLGVPIAAGFGY